jgi:eukaryotic-like serine/threonine-protein kinase
MADKTGQQVGSYRLVKLIGKGGFAEVYLGQHIRVASKQAAVKILYLYDVDVQKFQEEAEITEQLVHPHIVRLLDFDLHEETPFLVLDYASGGSLRHRHPKGSQVPLDIVVAYLNEIASALQYAHDRHILHRDIKPDNMLIGRQGELLLSDFGIAQLSQTGRSSIEASFVTGGTPFYMAPEMFRGKPEKASDQYSLAVVVYEWLCGVVPFSGGNFIQLGYQHTHDPVPPLRDKNPAVPFAVEQVIMKALAKIPKDRYPEVKDFAEDMESASIVTQRKEPPLEPIPSSTVPPVVASVSIETRGSGTPSFAEQHPPQPVSTPAPKTTAPKPPQQSSGETITPAVSTPVLDSTAITATCENCGNPIAPGSTFCSLCGVATSAETVAATRVKPVAKATPPVVPAQTPDTTGTIPHRRITRRKAIQLGAGTAVAVTGIGGIVYWLEHSKPAPGTTPGTVLETYQGSLTVAWSPDGNLIASTDGGPTVQVWVAANGRNIFTYRGHSDRVNSAAWSPDGKYIASGSDDKTVQVWDAMTGSRRITYKSDFVEAVAWSPDGKYIALATTKGFVTSEGPYNTVQVLDAITGTQRLTYAGHQGDIAAAILTVAWSPDGKYVASAVDDVQVWDATTGTQRLTYKGHTANVLAVAWSPDGKYIASGGNDKTVQVWNAADGGNFFTYRGHSGYVFSVAWSPDGNLIASAGDDPTVHVWAVANGRNVFTYQSHSNRVWSVAWSPDGKYIVSGGDNTQVWQAP